MPPCLGLPPRIQKMSRSKAASAVAALSALVALLSLMKSVAPQPADLLQPMRQARERRERGGHLARRDPEDERRALAASAFWMLWRPRSEPMPARSAKAPSGPVQGARATSSRAHRRTIHGHALARRDEVDPAAVGEPQALGDVAAPNQMVLLFVYLVARTYCSRRDPLGRRAAGGQGQLGHRVWCLVLGEAPGERRRVGVAERRSNVTTSTRSSGRVRSPSTRAA